MGDKRLTSKSNSQNSPAWLKECEQQATLSDVYHSDVTKPIIITMGSTGATEDLKRFVKKGKIVRFVDVFDEQLAELFISDNAQLYKATTTVKRQSVKQYLQDYKKNKQSWRLGTWVYYPWSGTLIHILNKQEFTKLRTLRNQFIINSDEQALYSSYKVGCVGMSVGSNGAAALAITGGSNRLKIADGAVFSGSNLNRVRTGVESVGLPKSTIIARELYEMNPYLEIDSLTSNITTKNIGKFFDKPWALDAVVDEVDDVIIKIRLRMEARKRGIPVVMVTEPGDTVMLDIERYDQDANLPLFHGLLKNAEAIAAAGSFKNEREKIKNIVKIIGVRNFPIRDQEAALKVGSVIPSAPQIGSTAMIAGGIIAYAVRQLATNAPMKSGRHRLDLNSQFWKPQAYLRYKLAHNKSSRDLSRIVSNM